MNNKIFKVLTMGLILFSSIFGTTLSATEVEVFDPYYMEAEPYMGGWIVGDDVIIGDWYGPVKNYMNSVSVGTTNLSSSSQTFNMYVYNRDSHEDVVRGIGCELSTGYECATHAVTTNPFDYHQFKVFAYDNNAKHKPWGWYI